MTQILIIKLMFFLRSVKEIQHIYKKKKKENLLQRTYYLH